MVLRSTSTLRLKLMLQVLDNDDELIMIIGRREAGLLLGVRALSRSAPARCSVVCMWTDAFDLLSSMFATMSCSWNFDLPADEANLLFLKQMRACCCASLKSI